MSKFNVLNFKKWIDENRHLLKPPVGNKMIWKDREFIVMVVGGPNEREDFHVNEGEEFFYQLEGEMILKVINDEGKMEDVNINAGDIYLLPSKVPHSPQRKANSIGLVVERKRLDHEEDGLQFYCRECQNLTYEEKFKLTNIETQFAAIYSNYYDNKGNHTCKDCGFVNGKFEGWS